MNILISTLSQTPIYEQIQEQLKEIVLTGRIKPGEQLPSVRLMAKDLKVGIITIKRAYAELENEGIVINLQGRGCFAAELDAARIKEIHLAMLAEQLVEIRRFSTTAGISYDEVVEVLHQVFGGDYNDK